MGEAILVEIDSYIFARKQFKPVAELLIVHAEFEERIYRTELFPAGHHTGLDVFAKWPSQVSVRQVLQVLTPCAVNRRSQHCHDLCIRNAGYNIPRSTR